MSFKSGSHVSQLSAFCMEGGTLGVLTCDTTSPEAFLSEGTSSSSTTGQQPSEVTSSKVSSITVWYSCLWASSRSSHSSLEKCMATSSKATRLPHEETARPGGQQVGSEKTTGAGPTGVLLSSQSHWPLFPDQSCPGSISDSAGPVTACGLGGAVSGGGRDEPAGSPEPPHRHWEG